jgi:hypothetical protein
MCTGQETSTPATAANAPARPTCWTTTGRCNARNRRLVAELGTGGLAGLHAQGTFQPTITGPTTTAGTYSVQFHFDP